MPGFSVCLLKLVTHQSVSADVRLQAAIQFKNLVAKRWLAVSALAVVVLPSAAAAYAVLPCSDPAASCRRPPPPSSNAGPTRNASWLSVIALRSLRMPWQAAFPRRTRRLFASSSST